VAVFLQAAVAVVVTHGVGGAEVGDPAGFEQRNQPRLMLSGYGDRAGDGQRQRASLADGVIEDGVDAAEERASESREAVREEVVQGIALVDSFDNDAFDIDSAPCG
jgi:hypothetical protein